MTGEPVSGPPKVARPMRWIVVALAVAGLIALALLVWRAVDRIALPLADKDRLEAQVREVALSMREADLAPPAGAGSAPFEVAEGESVDSVAARLEAEGLIRDADAFRLLAGSRGLDTGIQAGSHTIQRGAPAEDVLRALQTARGNGVLVTIPEGRRLEEIASLLAEAGIVEAEVFHAQADSADAARNPDFPMAAARPLSAGLEGYLFPDTYEFEPGSSAQTVVERLVGTFEQRAGPVIASSLRSGRSAHEIVTLASIVEREAQFARERPRIARVFLNRLDEPPYLLGADPTVQYGLGYQPETGQWWKRPLTLDDLQSSSPYNSYVEGGLPPGPIASPGLASIEGVVNPEPGPWMFFVADEIACDGTHVFAETFEEHQANVNEYRTGTCVP